MTHSNQQSNSTEEQFREAVTKLYGVKASHYVNFEPRLNQLIEAVNQFYLPREQVEALLLEGAPEDSTTPDIIAPMQVGINDTNRAWRQHIHNVLKGGKYA